MKKTFFFLTIIAAGVILLAGCSKGQSNKALLYRVSGGGLEKPSYILGTHHMAPLSILEGIKGFESAFESSEIVAGELLMSDMQTLQMAMMPHMSMPEGVTYRELLSEEDYAILDEALQRDLGAGLAMFGGMHPAALNIIYTTTMYANNMPDYDPAQTSIDQHIQLRANEEGKTVVGLETVEDQINAMFYSEPIEVMAQAVVEMAKNPEYYLNQVKELNKYYEEHNLDKLYEISFENPDDPFKMEEFELALLKERNDNWMEQLPAMMRQQSVFVAVGVGHLPGTDGILTQLRKMGYKVEPVK